MNKFHAKRTEWNGRIYASKREAEVAKELEFLKRCGQVLDIQYQPKFELIPKPNRIVYIADFGVTFKDGHREIWDVKGFLTAIFKLKAKLFRHFYPNETLVIVK